MSLTPEQVLSKEFQKTQFRRGYDERDVDDFLDEVVAELRSLISQRDEVKAQLDDCRAGRGLPAQPQKAATPPVAVAEVPDPAGSSGPVETSGSLPDSQRESAGVVASAAGAGMSGGASAAALIELAQRVHDEHVSTGQARHDELIAEAEARHGELISEAEARHGDLLSSGQARHDELIAEAEARHGELLSTGQARHDELVASGQAQHDDLVSTGQARHDELIAGAEEKAGALVSEAERRKNELLGSLEQQKSGLEAQIDELRGFERSYRSELRSFLEDKLSDLDGAGQPKEVRSDADADLGLPAGEVASSDEGGASVGDPEGAHAV